MMKAGSILVNHQPMQISLKTKEQTNVPNHQLHIRSIQRIISTHPTKGSTVILILVVDETLIFKLGAICVSIFRLTAETFIILRQFV